MKNELVKYTFQNAFNEFKEQYMEDIAPEKKEEFNELFKVSLNEKDGICVDGTYIGINVSDCDDSESFAHQVQPEYIAVFIGEYTTAVLHLSSEYGDSIPQIKSVQINKEVYSCDQE